MKFVFNLVLFICLSASMLSAQDAAKEYKAHNEGWLVDLDEAYEQSQKTGLPIVANFTGSDWCGWCIRLTKNVFDTKEFQSWSDKNAILLELDFPKRSKLPGKIASQNTNLKNAFKVTGFPTVWVFDVAKDDTGKFKITPHGKTGYKATPQEFIGDIEQMLVGRKGKA